MPKTKTAAADQPGTVTIVDGEAVLPEDVQGDLSASDTYLETYRSGPDDEPAHAFQRDDGTWVLRSETDGTASWKLKRMSAYAEEGGSPRG